MTNVEPNCMKINANHIPNQEEIEPGMILLNDFKGNVTMDNKSTLLQGTYIIIFQPLPALVQPWESVDSISRNDEKVANRIH